MYLRYFLHTNKKKYHNNTDIRIDRNLCIMKVGFISSARGYLLGAFANFEKRLLASCLSICMQQLCSHWTDFHGNRYLGVFRKSVEKILGSSKLTRITGTLHDDLCTFMTISFWIILRIKNVSDKLYSGNQNIHFIFNIPPPPLENRNVYEIM